MSNKPLKTLFIFNGIFVFAGSLLGPLYALYVGTVDKNILSVSITWASFFVASFIFTIIVSKVGDKIKEKRYLLMAGFLVRAVAWFMFIFAGNVFHFVLLQTLLGLGEALGTPTFYAIFAEHLDRGKHIREYADWKLIVNGTTAVGTIIGGLVVTTLGFSWLFAAMSGFAVVSFLGVLVQPRKLLW